MTLVEVHVINKNHKYWDELDNLCFLSKNLYNSTLYRVRQHYFETETYLNYNKVNKEFTDSGQKDYIALPRKVSKWTQKLVEQDFKSFFKLLKKKSSGSYSKKVSLPKYADSIKGRKALHYEKGALSFVKKGYIRLSQTNIFIKTDLDKKDVSYVKISHCGSIIKILVGYKVECKESKPNGNYASIDLGINNLATVSSNVFEPFIINGKPLKSINQYANKKKAYYQSKLPKGKFSSKKLENIIVKRNNKINDYMHKSSTYIVNQLISNEVSTLVIGYNKDWKQDTNIGNVNNQNFVQIPFYKFKKMLEYKCQLQGITVAEQEESYTSKCSFLDNEEIKKHTKYKGNRVNRGLFVSSNGSKINADLNGSLNILKKYLKKKVVWNNQIWLDLIEVCSKPNLKVINFE